MRIKTVLFALISIFLPLFLIEGGVRLVASDYIDGRATFAGWLAAMADELVARKTIDGRDVYYSAYLPSRYYRDAPKIRGNIVDAIKGPKTFRILSVGGSSTAGSPFGHWASYSRFLNDGLAAIVRPGSKVEVMNLGISSGSSTTVRVLLGHLDMLAPDLIIVLGGDNEICDANTALDAAGVSRGASNETIRRIARLVARYSYTYRLLDIGFDPRPQEQLYKKYPCPSRLRPLKRRQDLDILTEQLRKNIAAITELAKGMGAEVLLVGPAVNYLSPPGEFTRDTEPEVRQAIDDMVEAFSARDRDAYTRARRALLAVDPESAMPLFYDGLSAFRDGHHQKARELFEAALSADRRPVRARPAYREVLAAAAADNAVSYLDVMDIIVELVPDGIPDGRLLTDEAHATVELNRLTADKIISTYFSANGIRPDLFAYDRYDGGSVYRQVPEEEYYRSICKRYYETSDWRACIEKAMGTLNLAKSNGDFSLYRRTLSVWEQLFYYGRVNNDAAALARSRELFRPRTLALPSG